MAAEAVERLLDCFSIAVLLVGADRGIVHANLAARAMLQDHDIIRSMRGRLALPNPQATVALANAIRRAGVETYGFGPRGVAVPARRRDGSPAVVHVLPLPPQRGPSGAVPRIVAAVVASAPRPPQVPAAALASLFELTPAETRVLELIVEGRAPAEIGCRLGVSAATVRTHLQRVFDKTGSSRQADLVRLVACLALPL
jgi:DNA-binding CsgD family transcriptional regulator